jgi:hypothetical protein
MKPVTINAMETGSGALRLLNTSLSPRPMMAVGMLPTMTNSAIRQPAPCRADAEPSPVTKPPTAAATSRLR